MNTSAIPQPATRRRRIRYVDQTLQKWLVIVVILEVGAAVAAIGMLYLRLSGLIEDNLYRVHFAASDSMVPVLLHDGFMLLLAFLALNIVALLLATAIWGRYVGGILRDFAALVGKTIHLDFSSDATHHRPHEVLALAGNWRAKERVRLAAISEQIAQLDAADPALVDKSGAQAVVGRLRELLR